MGYFPACSVHESSRLLPSESERKGIPPDVIRLTHSDSQSNSSGDVMLGEAGDEDGQISSEDASGANTSETVYMVSAPAVRHASRFSCQFAQDMACSWDALGDSLPSFHGVGWAEEQGKRNEMEDGTVVIRDFGGMPGAWLLAIYDGHGGRATVSLLLQRLHDNLLHQLQERGSERWKSLKSQAQCRRSLVADLLESQQRLLQAQRQQRTPQCRQQRLHATTDREMHFWPRERSDFPTQSSTDTQTSKDLMADTHYPQVENEVVDQVKQERIDAYWQLLRIHQLLHVLRWMEEGCADPGADPQNEDNQCLSPHCLLVCTEDDVRSAFSDAFRQTDEELLQKGIVQSGATACVALLRPCIDFQRLVTMSPEEFTDRDWLLFSGSNVSFPLEGKRHGEGESVDQEGRMLCSAVGSPPSDSQANAPAGEGAVAAANAGKNTAATPSSEAEQEPKFTEEDVPRVASQHNEVSCAPSGNASVGASQSVNRSTEGSQKTEKTRMISSLLSVRLSVAHLGDSRALLVALDGSCERLTAATDHKASSFQEVLRVEEAGGWVFGERVNGMLAIGRAFGDWCLKLSPEELKVFSGVATKGDDAERTEDCDEKGNRGETETEQDVEGGCEDSITDRTSLQMMPDCLEEFLSKTPELDSCAVNGDEAGDVVNEEVGEAMEKRLTASQPHTDKMPVTRRGRSFSRNHFSSRKHTLVVSNEPHICTRDLLVFQSNDLFKNSAPVATSGSEDGVGSETPATTSRDAQLVSGDCSTESGGLTAPPVLLLLGCDGLFDVCSDHAVTAIALEFLRELQETHPDLTPSNAAEAVARALIEEAITFRGSTDNVSVTVALLLPMSFCGTEEVGED